MAITCNLNKNLTKADFCGYSLRSVNAIYLANFEDSGVKLTVAEDGYEVTAATGTWYKVTPAKDTTSYNDDLVVGGNGAKYRTHTLSFSFNGTYDKNLAEILDSLSLGKYIAVLDLSDGTAVALGRTVGLEASAASSLSEAAADGNQGLQITLEANVAESALPVNATAMESIRTSANGD